MNRQGGLEPLTVGSSEQVHYHGKHSTIQLSFEGMCQNHDRIPRNGGHNYHRNFSPVNIENPNELFRLDSCSHGSVDVFYDPLEQLGVDVFSESVTPDIGLNRKHRISDWRCSESESPAGALSTLPWIPSQNG